MVFIGDLCQLPPVIKGKERKIFRTRYKTGYFFSAQAFEELPMEFIELMKIYRQKDERFIEILNAIRNSIKTRTLGSFTQFPLRLAWSITIHKSQGKTFQRLILDIERGAFSPGQIYVVLSRCTSLEGIVLKQPIERKHVFMDWRVVDFITRYQYELSEEKMPMEQKLNFLGTESWK